MSLPRSQGQSISMPPSPFSKKPATPFKGNPEDIAAGGDEDMAAQNKRKGCFKSPPPGAKKLNYDAEASLEDSGAVSDLGGGPSGVTAESAGGGLAAVGGGGAAVGAAVGVGVAAGGVAGLGPGLGGGGPGLASGGRTAVTPEGEVSSKDILKQMQKMDLNINTKFDVLQTQFASVQTQISDLKGDLARLKEEFVTKVVFDSLEARVASLEQIGVKSPEVSWLKDQVNRLDPCNKCISFKGFQTSSAPERNICLQKYLEEVLGNPRVQSIEHISGWIDGVRKMTPVSIVEFASRSVREEVLKLANEKLSFRDNTGAVLTAQRAKSAVQRKRNAALGQAFDLLKKHETAKGKTVELAWKIEDLDAKDKGLRGVRVNGSFVFRQELGDISGVFSAPFETLQV